MRVAADMDVVPDWDAMGVRGQEGPQVMPFVALPGAYEAQAPGSERESREHETPATRTNRFAVMVLLLLPGVLVVFMGFNAGGYFPGTPAIVVVLLSQVLLVRVVCSGRPFEGLAPVTLVAVVALGLYALETLVSVLWSRSWGRALIEFDRAWMYLLILLLFGSVRATAQDLRWLVRGLLLGVSIVCLAGLTSRVLPDVWRTAPDVSNQRLSYPVTYWNTLGLLAALGIVLAFHLACSLGERVWVRVLAAGVLPLLAGTLFFTFSRGAIAAGTIGLVVYVLVARPHGLISGVLAILPATVVLVLVAYHATLLDTVDPTTPAAVSQGHRVALVAGICVLSCAGLRWLLALGLDPRLRGRSGTPWMSRGVRVAVTMGAVAVFVALVLVLGGAHTISGDWDRFISGAPTAGGHDLRARLTDPSDDGRTDLWRVALQGFSASPVHGYGAGMYQTLWERDRSSFAFVINAHSLYLQALAELGLPGLILLLVMIFAVLIGLGLRARGPARSLYAVLLAFCVIWVLRAGVDWDWEMPVVTLGFFAIAGAALNPRNKSPAPPAPSALSEPSASSGPSESSGPSGLWGRGFGWNPGWGARLMLGLACLLSIVIPVLIIGSQTRLTEAEHALYASDCARAVPAARSSIGWLGVRPEPYEILGFCDLQHDQPRQAVIEMQEALRQDPGSWEPYYTLAIAQAAAGIDPRNTIKQALRMNPLEHLTRQATKDLQHTTRPTQWTSRAHTLLTTALASRNLSTVPS